MVLNKLEETDEQCFNTMLILKFRNCDSGLTSGTRKEKEEGRSMGGKKEMCSRWIINITGTEK